MMPPMVTRLATSEGEVTPELIDRYVLYAGGMGLSVMEAIAVEKQKSGQLLRLNDDSYVPGMRELTGGSTLRPAPRSRRSSSTS